ncbi:MAG: AAA family ATPase [Archaeoglobaceae archaeon]|nr:AAA family ATPase [Archaeoglobaceae archaeon]MDW7990212.1 AAA family ATPase [Archaeoglobaceae archaeon]
MVERIDELYRESLTLYTSPILKSGGLKYLSDKYIPENPLYRKEHILKLSKWVYEFIDNSIPGTIFLEGPSGTGKTMCFKIVEKFANRRMQEESISESRIIYINGRNRTIMNVLTEILNTIGVHTPHRGLSYGEVISRLLETSRRVPIHVCIDEIDQLRVYQDSFNVEDLLYLFSRNEGLSLTTITNNYNFLGDLEDSRVRSSITKEKNLIFERYNKKQCFDILWERCENAFRKNVISEGVVSKLADYVSDVSGDIRDGIDTLRACVEICQGDGLQIIDEKVLERAVELYRNRRMIQKIHALSNSQRTVLAAYYFNIISNGRTEQTMEEIFDMYYTLREKMGKTSTIQDVRARVADLVTFSLLESIKSGRGPRKGVERRYRALIPMEVIYRALITDPELSDIAKGLIDEVRKKRLRNYI